MIAFLGLQGISARSVRVRLGLQKTHVGLDIQEDCVRLVHLQEHSGRKSLTRGVSVVAAVAKAEIPVGVICNGQILDKDALTAIIRQLAVDTNLVGAECAVGLSGHSVIMKKVSLPQMTMQELEDSMQWEAEQYIPFDIKDVNVDFRLVATEPKRMSSDVLLFAAKKVAIEELCTVVENAGLVPVIVDSANLALADMVLMSEPTCSEEHPVVCIDVRSDVTCVSVLDKGVCVFLRDITISNADKVHSADEYRVEIVRSVDFFSATAIDCHFDRVFITHGSLHREALEKSLAISFGQTVTVIDPFRVTSMRMDIAEKTEEVRNSIVAVGLALRVYADVYAPRQANDEMNLLGRLVKPKKSMLLHDFVETLRGKWPQKNRRTKLVVTIAAYSALLFGIITSATIFGNYLSRLLFH